MNKKNYFVKYVIFCVAVCLVIGASTQNAFSYRFDLKKDFWEVEKGDHFIVFYHPSISRDYVEEFIDNCEGYYDSIKDRLGFSRYDFWLWEDRATIFIFKEKEEYLEKCGRKEWSAASVNYNKKIIKTFYQEEDFLETILPHEVSHIILREFIGMKVKAPLWFDEGVAVVNEKGCLQKYLFVAKCLVENGYYIPVDKMDSITNKQLIAPTVFYPMAGALIIFLFEKKGEKGFLSFCEELKRKVNFYDAIDAVYGIKSPEELNREIVAYLESLEYEDIKNANGFDVEWP